VLFTGYDIPTFSLLCDPVTEVFFGKFCGSDKSCSNQLEVEVQKKYSAALEKMFAKYPFTYASFIGAAQKGSGIAGADVGKPVIDQSVPEKNTAFCVHPKYGTPAGDAWTDAFWDKYFKQEVGHLMQANATAMDLTVV